MKRDKGATWGAANLTVVLAALDCGVRHPVDRAAAGLRAWHASAMLSLSLAPPAAPRLRCSIVSESGNIRLLKLIRIFVWQ